MSRFSSVRKDADPQANAERGRFRMQYLPLFFMLIGYLIWRAACRALLLPPLAAAIGVDADALTVTAGSVSLPFAPLISELVVFAAFVTAALLIGFAVRLVKRIPKSGKSFSRPARFDQNPAVPAEASLPAATDPKDLAAPPSDRRVELRARLNRLLNSPCDPRRS